jgi:hypothetical protein
VFRHNRGVIARRLEHVLQRFEKSNLLLQPTKCVFAKSEVQYLGYVVSRDGIAASPDKVRAVKEYPLPKNAKHVRAFLGLASFYRRLIPKFAEIAKPLTELIRKGVPFLWQARQQTAFSKLKDTLCSSEVLAYPDFNTQFILTTNASRIAVAAILSQVQDCVEKPVSYASRHKSRIPASCVFKIATHCLVHSTQSRSCIHHASNKATDCADGLE